MVFEDCDTEKIVFIIIGWLLGILGQPLVRGIINSYKRKEYRVVIRSELKNLCVRLAAGCRLIQEHMGIGTKSTWLWLESIYNKHYEDCPKKVKDAITKFTKLSDEEIEAINMRTKSSENVGLSLKKFSLSFSESLIDKLALFEVDFQRKMLEIVSQVAILNQDIDSYSYYHQLTFDPTTMRNNGKAIKENIQLLCVNIANRCESLATKIDNVLDKVDEGNPRL